MEHSKALKSITDCIDYIEQEVTDIGAAVQEGGTLDRHRLGIFTAALLKLGQFAEVLTEGENSET